MTCAAPAYLARHGMPASPDALDGHRMIGFVRSPPGGCCRSNSSSAKTLQEILLPTTMSVTATDSYLATARLGLGLIQTPRFHAEKDLARRHAGAGAADYPPPPIPLSVLYPRNRQFSPRLRVFLDWAMRLFGRA